MIYRPRRFVAAIASSTLALLAQAQAAEDEPLEQVVVTGTRVANRSALDTAVPVDVVSAEQLQNVGVAEVNQALSVALPSFNFPRPGLADGTDTIRPATLRGLAPDQTLVLVNGKRRHRGFARQRQRHGRPRLHRRRPQHDSRPRSCSRSKCCATAPRRSTAPTRSPACINLRLREAHDGGDASVTYGWRESSYDTPTAAPDDRFAGAVLTPRGRRRRRCSATFPTARR